MPPVYPSSRCQNLPAWTSLPFPRHFLSRTQRIPSWVSKFPICWQQPSTQPAVSSKSRTGWAAPAPSSSSQHRCCGCPTNPRKNCWERGGGSWRGDSLSWKHFHSESQINFSSATSILMYSITPKPSCATAWREGSHGLCWQALGPVGLANWRNTRQRWNSQLQEGVGESNTYSNTASLHSYAVLCSPTL